MFTTTSMTAVNVSMRSAQSTFELPEVNQFASTGDHRLALAERHVEKHDPRHDRACDEQAGGDEFRGARADLAPEVARDQKADEWEKDDCLDHRAVSPSSC